jgi:hypothetical protein
VLVSEPSSEKVVEDTRADCMNSLSRIASPSLDHKFLAASAEADQNPRFKSIASCEQRLGIQEALKGQKEIPYREVRS